MPIIRERVDGLRKQRGMRSLDDLLERIQEHQASMAWSTLSQIINDRRSPRLDNVEAIARALDTTVAYLIGETANPAPELDAGEPLPEVRTWSERLRAMAPGQRAKFVQGVELMLAAFEAGNAGPR